MHSAWKQTAVGVVACGFVFGAVARAVDYTLPTFRSQAGAFLVGESHNFFIESELQLPILTINPVSLYYRHRESTPFLDLPGVVQAELLYGRDELHASWKMGDELRLITLGGYQSSRFADRSGRLQGFVYGAGFGSPYASDERQMHWFVTAGTYADRRDLDSDWWADGYCWWRVFEFHRDKYLDSEYRASIALAADIESSNAGDWFRPLYRIGPELQLRTANNNRASLQLHWYYNDDNPFYGHDENGLLLALDVTSSRVDDYLLNARELREKGFFPLVWGQYDIGLASSRTVTRFEINVELMDFIIAGHPITPSVWYETRQEYRIGDYDNVIYSVALGMQTPVGLASPLSHGDPLVLGFDFLHRSDHALDPDADRVAAVGEPTPRGPMISNGAINLLPRLRLQTLGWDTPYRDPSMYERRTDWLHLVDWRVCLGLDARSTRERGAVAGQLGVNCDVATVQGYVVYLRGIGSLGNETPDWLGEIGVRRPAFRLFTRYESYGVDHNIAGHDTLWFGAGVNL